MVGQRAQGASDGGSAGLRLNAEHRLRNPDAQAVRQIREKVAAYGLWVLQTLVQPGRIIVEIKSLKQVRFGRWLESYAGAGLISRREQAEDNLLPHASVVGMITD